MRWGATAIASYSQVSVLAITYSPYVEVYVSLRGLEIYLDFIRLIMRLREAHFLPKL